jgi:hypothetical protein
MNSVNAFVAYPSEPRLIGDAIQAAVVRWNDIAGAERLRAWPATNIAGQFIRDRILNEIDQREALIADVSALNFNVTYEVGFAIGRGKSVILVRNEAVKPDSRAAELGIFDTLGWRPYQNAAHLLEIFGSLPSALRIPITRSPDARTPVYLLEPRHKTDAALRVTSRVKKCGLFYRSFDPNEQSRLSADEALRNVAQSYGVLVFLLDIGIQDSHLHNLRAAFIAGLAEGMEVKLSILQFTESDPVPLDCRDLVETCTANARIDEAIGEFAAGTTEALQQTVVAVTKPETFLASMTLGSSAAENEFRELSNYYLETDAFKRAFRGEIRIVAGRKGAGKTALFFQLRDRLRQHGTRVVLDLKPEGYQLLKFKEAVLRLLAEGTFEHTVTAFWEYLLLVEICHKVLHDDAIRHRRQTNLFVPYGELSELYSVHGYGGEGDFSERMSRLIGNIVSRYHERFFDQPEAVLSNAEVTQLIHEHDLPRLREALENYLKFKDSVWMLFDNIDKGWPAHGIQREDVTLLRCLIDATRKVEQQLQRAGITTHLVLFLRNDVYDILVDETSDRGKEAKAVLDWTEADYLRELLRLRFVFSGAKDDAKFLDIWRTICVSQFQHQESSQFLIERSLMRPRYLINLVNHCRSHAVNLRHRKIEPDDIERGMLSYSNDLLNDVGLEIRDVMPAAENVLYAFIDVAATLSESELRDLLEAGGFGTNCERLTELLLWYGVLGILKALGKAIYIYETNYDMHLLMGIRKKESDLIYVVNPAFWPSLSVRQSRLLDT